MAKLYFKYGAMGSSKSAQALITQFNYEELGMTVWLIKPSVDDRDGANIVKSRVGLSREAEVITPEDSIRARYEATGGRDVIIADEAQFLTPEQIDELRDIVDELNVPVLCLSQLSRANESRSDKRPMLSDLRESGAIEQDADIVMFLYRDDYYNPESEYRNQAECIIAKNRHGETGKVMLQWLPEFTTFSGLDWQHQE